MDPPKAERFLRATTNGTTVDGMLQPFGNPPPALDGGPRLTKTQKRDLVKAIQSAPEALAFALDRAINNTSVVALFTYRGKGLLLHAARGRAYKPNEARCIPPAADTTASAVLTVRCPALPRP